MMQEKLIKVWSACETKQMSDIFKEYMENIGIRKYNGRRKDNKESYDIDGKSASWNRVECYYYKDSTQFREDDLSIVLRKRAGDYLIIQRKGIRAFECDDRGVISYDENLLNEIMKDHKPLFDKLIGLIS